MVWTRTVILVEGLRKGEETIQGILAIIFPAMDNGAIPRDIFTVGVVTFS